MSKHTFYLCGLATLLILISLFIGLFGGKNIIPWHISHIDQVILLELRLPKIITAITVGICLALAGHIFQLLLANPLAEPSLLGISGIASLAVIIGAAGLSFVVIEHSVFFMFAFALFGAFVAIGLIFTLAGKLGSYSSLAIILAGICITTITSAISSWLIFYSNNDQLRTFSLWMLGSFEHVSLTSSIVMFSISLIIILYLKSRSRALNFVYLGDRTAILYGIDIKRLRTECLTLAALLSAVAVSLGGIVAFVGLLVPHACRMIYGNDNNKLIYKLALSGASIMVLVEFLSRSVMSTTLPLALISATLGGPLFIWVLLKHFTYQGR